MKTVGYDQPLYILPFDPRGSFETKRFDGHGDLTPEQTAEIAAARQVIYDGFKAAKTITREAAVAEIARRYQEFVGIFEKARTA